MTTDQIINEYLNAYFNVHGKYPKVLKKGSWVHINNMSPCRASDIPKLTRTLLFTARKKEAPKKEEYSEIECLMSIKKEAKSIFGSTNVKMMQISAKNIVKMVTTIMNIQEEEEK
jgi:hypothetical protein